MTAPRPIFIAALGIAVAALWGPYIIRGLHERCGAGMMETMT